MNRHLMATKSSHRSSLRRLGVCIMLLAALLFLASSAYASVISIGLQEASVNGGAITTLVTSPTGTISLPATAYGSWSVNQAQASDVTNLGLPDLLNSNVLDTSTDTAGVITVWITTQGLSHTGAINFSSAFAVNALHGGVASVIETTYFSPANAIYGGTMLDTATFTAIGTKGPDIAMGTTSGLFSVTERYDITDVGSHGGNDNLTIDLSGAAVPEPASLGLIGTGLLSIFALKFRR